MRHMFVIAAIGLSTALAGCNTSDQQELANVAAISCNGAEVAAAASIAISAEVGASAQAQADAATAQKVTSTACAALSQLPTILSASSSSTQAQAIYRRWKHDMPKSVLNSAKFRAYIERTTDVYHY